MNWKRGLFRVWTVGSTVWTVANIWQAYRQGIDLKNALTSGRLPPPPSGYVIDVGGIYDKDFWLFTVIAPPLLVGIALGLMLWIARGFRPPQSK